MRDAPIVLLGDPEQPEAVDHDRDRQLAGDHHRGQAARAERAHGDERDRHVDRAEQPADQRPPRERARCWPRLPRPPRDERRRSSTSTTVPTRNEKVAACRLPTVLPRRALIGACMPTRQPEPTAQPSSDSRSARGSLRLQPVRAHADVDRQRRLACSHTPHHLALDQLARGV